MKLNSREYYILKDFLANVWPLIRPEPRAPELHPIFNLERLEKELPSRAAEGLQMAVDDILNRSIGWPKEITQRYDGILKAKGSLTVSEARVKYWKKFSKLLKSKMIRTEPDYYFLKSVYDDSTELLDDDEKQAVAQLLDDFEKRKIR